MNPILPGFLVTMADASCRKMDVIGPQGLIHFIAAMRTYAKRYVIPCDILIVELYLPQGLLLCQTY